MERLRQWALLVLALVLILGAAATVLLLSQPPVESHRLFARKPFNRPAASERESAAPFTYRFLLPTEQEAAPGKLTLGRFASGRLCNSATWEFDSIDQWHGRAPSIFESQTRWTPEEQPGWQISRWLSERVGSACDSAICRICIFIESLLPRICP